MSAILRTIAQRLGLGLITLFVVSIIIFAAIAMLPGDYARSKLGQAATPETVAAFEHEIGLKLVEAGPRRRKARAARQVVALTLVDEFPLTPKPVVVIPNGSLELLDQ